MGIASAHDAILMGDRRPEPPMHMGNDETLQGEFSMRTASLAVTGWYPTNASLLPAVLE